jgi:hypothetical protein
MPRMSLKETLMSRDNLTEEQAEEQIQAARNNLYDRLEHGEMPFDICAEWFGLEPDYIDELM